MNKIKKHQSIWKTYFRSCSRLCSENILISKWFRMLLKLSMIKLLWAGWATTHLWFIKFLPSGRRYNWSQKAFTSQSWKFSKNGWPFHILMMKIINKAALISIIRIRNLTIGNFSQEFRALTSYSTLQKPVSAKLVHWSILLQMQRGLKKLVVNMRIMFSFTANWMNTWVMNWTLNNKRIF